MLQISLREPVSFLILLLSGTMLLGQNPKPSPSESPKPNPSAKDDKSSEFEPPPPVVTEHSLTLPDGKTLRYQAITGYLVLRDTVAEQNKAQEEEEESEDSEPESSAEPKKSEKPVDPTKGKPKAQVFFVAYVAEDVGDPAARPLTFAFNGGPGSSSVWLHLGGLGPRRAQLSDAGEALPPPSKLVDNESTWLPKTDLVFIDPVGTGYSRPAPGEDAKQFWRWASPKFIAGESYGTTRAAGLSDYLENRYGLYLNGIVLISSVLNFQAIDFSPGNDQPYPLFLPSYASAAWYHKKLSADLEQLSLPDLLSKVEEFAANDYERALSRGDRLSPDEKSAMAAQLARFTGLSQQRFLQLSLREPDSLFFNDLLWDQNRSVGRYDSRFTGIRSYPGTDREDSDPSDEAVDSPFTSAFYTYVRQDLKYESELPYERIAEVHPWLFSRNKYLDVAQDLKKAMNRNRYLRVMVCCGYYDLATPYFAAENVVHTMNLDPAVRNNVTLSFYGCGHMVYLESASRKKLQTDFGQFVDSALSMEPVPSASRDVK
jgi:carboxypeptidase C (cathepsin A)